MNVTFDQQDQVRKMTYEQGNYESRRALCIGVLEAQRAAERRAYDAKVERIYKATGVRVVDVQLPVDKV